MAEKHLHLHMDMVVDGEMRVWVAKNSFTYYLVISLESKLWKHSHINPFWLEMVYYIPFATSYIVLFSETRMYLMIWHMKICNGTRKFFSRWFLMIQWNFVDEGESTWRQRRRWWQWHTCQIRFSRARMPLWIEWFVVLQLTTFVCCCCAALMNLCRPWSHKKAQIKKNRYIKIPERTKQYEKTAKHTRGERGWNL